MCVHFFFFFFSPLSRYHIFFLSLFPRCRWSKCFRVTEKTEEKKKSLKKRRKYIYVYVECRKCKTSLYQKIDFERKINEYVKNFRVFKLEDYSGLVIRCWSFNSFFRYEEICQKKKKIITEKEENRMLGKIWRIMIEKIVKVIFEV